MDTDNGFESTSWVQAENEILKETYSSAQGIKFRIQIIYKVSQIPQELAGEISSIMQWRKDSPLLKTESIAVLVSPVFGDLKEEKKYLCKFETFSGQLSSQLIPTQPANNLEQGIQLFFLKSSGVEAVWSCSKIFESGEDFTFQVLDENQEWIINLPFANSPEFHDLRQKLKGYE